VSRRTPHSFFFSSSSTEPREDNDVDEADWVGESVGDTATEFADVDGAESAVVVLLRTELWGRAVEAMLRS
jgi:hypothetical protein